MDKLVVKFEGTILEERVGYEIYKTFGDLFLPGQYGARGVTEQGLMQDLMKLGGQGNLRLHD